MTLAGSALAGSALGFFTVNAALSPKKHAAADISVVSIPHTQLRNYFCRAASLRFVISTNRRSSEMADVQQARKGRARRTDVLRRWLQTQGVQCETALREATLFCSTVEELAWASPEDLTWLTEAWDPSDRATLLRAIDEARSAIEAGRTPEGVVVEESSLPPPLVKSARVATATSGYDTLDADVLTKVLEFLPLDDAAAAKQLSSTTASAARRALTRGRWRPFKTFCLDGDEHGCRTTYHQAYTDQDRALFREVWALEPGAVLKEITSWHPMSSTGSNCPEIEGALRYLALVEPDAMSGFGRIAAAFAGSGELASSKDATGILVQWSYRVGGFGHVHSGLTFGSIDLGLGAWATPKDGAAFILRQVHAFDWPYRSFMRQCERHWHARRRRSVEAFLEAREEIA
jgi:hypothetical protein